jgi:hypothetical protein
MQALSLLGKQWCYFGNNTAQFFIGSSSFKRYIFYYKIVKRALLFFGYHITLCPIVKMLSLKIVIAFYRYCFSRLYARYRFVPLSLKGNW